MSIKSPRPYGRNPSTSITAELRERFGIHPDLDPIDAEIEVWGGFMKLEAAWFCRHPGQRYRLRRPLPTEFTDDIERKGLYVVVRYLPTNPKTQVWPLGFRFLKRPAKLDQETLADIWRICHFIAEHYGYEIEQGIKRQLVLPFADKATTFEVEHVPSNWSSGWIDHDEVNQFAA